MVAPDKADSYLRRIREATFTEAKVTSRLDVQVDSKRIRYRYR